VPTVVLNGIDVYFERRGEGPRLLFLNGSGGNLVTAAPIITPFAKAFDVVAHDQRGLGRTAIPPGPYSMADYAADAVALIDDIGWDTCRVVGISFGGMVAQELAVTWPDRIERLALLCTSPGGVGGSSYPLHELAKLGADERDSVWLRILDTRFSPEWLADHADDRLLVESIAARTHAERTEEQRRGEAEQIEARRYHNVWDRLPAITCPTLVAAGRYDDIAPVSNSEAIVSRLPNAELRTFEGGHAFVAQDPDAFPAIIEFLQR
jgi:3-oxoadipate enol-lactonase